MGHVYVKNEIYEFPSTAHDSAVNNTDVIEFGSSMDDIFTRLLTLANYIGDQLMQFIEDLVLGDLSRCLENLMVSSSEPHSSPLRHSISESFPEDSSSSYKPCNDCTCPRIRARRAR